MTHVEWERRHGYPSAWNTRQVPGSVQNGYFFLFFLRPTFPKLWALKGDKNENLVKFSNEIPYDLTRSSSWFNHHRRRRRPFGTIHRVHWLAKTTLANLAVSEQPAHREKVHTLGSPANTWWMEWVRSSQNIASAGQFSEGGSRQSKVCLFAMNPKPPPPPTIYPLIMWIIAPKPNILFKVRTKSIRYQNCVKELCFVRVCVCTVSAFLSKINLHAENRKPKETGKWKQKSPISRGKEHVNPFKWMNHSAVFFAMVTRILWAFLTACCHGR